jgi:hypothetical protein
MDKLNGKTLIGVDVLQDDAANDVAALATRLGGKQTNIALSGRKFWKDGAWNTLVLPFAMTAEQVTATSPPHDCSSLTSKAAKPSAATARHRASRKLPTPSPAPLLHGRGALQSGTRWMDANSSPSQLLKACTSITEERS